MNISQTSAKNRLMLAVPVFAVGFALTFIDFNIIWRYFAFSNQTLATIVLWASAMYMVHQDKSHWLASLPATFMTAVCTTYIMMAPEGLTLPTNVAYPAGIVASIFGSDLVPESGIKQKSKSSSRCLIVPLFCSS